MSAEATTAAVRIDPRGPRFGAAITSTLLLITVYLGLTGLSTSGVAEASVAERALDPGFLLLAFVSLTFLVGAVAGVQRHPYGLLFRALVRPRLQPPAELEDAAPPTFAQFVGLLVAGTGLVLHLTGVAWAIPVAAGAAFLAAFLNAAFAFCLGCQIYLLLGRAGILRTPGVA